MATAKGSTGKAPKGNLEISPPHPPPGANLELLCPIHSRGSRRTLDPPPPAVALHALHALSQDWSRGAALAVQVPSARFRLAFRVGTGTHAGEGTFRTGSPWRGRVPRVRRCVCVRAQPEHAARVCQGRHCRACAAPVRSQAGCCRGAVPALQCTTRREHCELMRRFPLSPDVHSRSSFFYFRHAAVLPSFSERLAGRQPDRFNARVRCDCLSARGAGRTRARPAV